MSRHLVCITFDFDAMSGLVARGMTSPTPVSRGEFGPVAVAERILPLLKDRGIRSTFFIPGVVIETYPDHARMIHEAGHEIGHHGYTHVPPADLTAAQEEDGLVKGMALIEAVTGAKPRGYRSPSWDLSEATIGLLLKHGFAYESSLMGHDHLPYYARQGDVIRADGPTSFGAPNALVEMPISWSLDDFPHFEFLRTPTSLLPGLSNARLVLENFVADFEYMAHSTDWGVLTYTFHPYVIGRGHRMLMLEGLIDALKERGAEFVAMEDAAAEFRARG